jgi:hypothetical protein
MQGKVYKLVVYDWVILQENIPKEFGFTKGQQGCNSGLTRIKEALVCVIPLCVRRSRAP